MIGIQQTQAKLTFGKSEKLKVVHDFPNTDEYMSDPGRFMDLGIIYETFNVAGLPFWITKDPVIIGLENHNTEVYFELTAQEVTQIVAQHQLSKEALTKLSFFDKHLGLVIAIVIAALYIIYSLFIKEDEDDDLLVDHENNQGTIS